MIPSAHPRVAILAAGELFGGVERHVLGLAGELAESAASPPPVILFHDAELAARSRAAGLPTTVLASRHRYDPAPARQLAGILEEQGISLVHAHGYRAVATCLAARRRRPLAVVKTEHGLVEPMAGRLVRGLRLRLNVALEDWASRRLGARVCYVTDDLRRRCGRRHRGLAGDVVPNGIAPLDREAFARPDEMPPEAAYAVILGRVTAVKGIEYALAAAAMPDWPARLRLLVIGSGPARERLERAARRDVPADRVRFLGFRSDAMAFLAHADALLMPSLHEGLPYTLLEAMSLGTPALVSRVGGPAEVIRDGETGWLLPPRDPVSIAAACARLVDDPAAARRLGAAAAADQRERFTLEAMTAAYARIYAGAAI